MPPDNDFADSDGEAAGPSLIVCPRHTLLDIASTPSIRRFLMLSSQAEEPPAELVRRKSVFTRLIFHDIAEPRAGLQMPLASDVRAILKAGRDALASSEPLAISCFAAVSRSTAAAYIIACDRAGPGREGDLARQLRLRSAEATPNPALIGLADQILERGGAMIEAIAAIGRGAECREGRSFSWTV
ncbi:tyrosine phosphatase family protein [Notoacmeibacter ruber]|uniref:Protein tyrosine phosphatase n=1 Tax=Notoacmeibacter ruber TaxID=2670375 RepID=A0A3L7JG76_9HYPH|nr:protein tyrosine phosphatase [Notoacmeibacter ruber]RLQ89209.1 protein tyrosine phosphatase [Notoacmeibacter ruber]